jgi:hypothetical protein
MLREMIAANPLPDYLLEEEPGDILRVTPRDAVIEAAGRPLLAPETYEAARALLPGADVYALEAEWRAWWVATGRRARPRLPARARQGVSGRWVPRYFDVFGRDAVKVFRFEEITREPERVIVELLEFIGVDPEEVSREMPRTNTRRAPRFPGLTQVLTSPPRPLRPLVAPVKAVLNRMGVKPSEVVMKYLSRPATRDETGIPPDLRKEVQAAFAEDIARLEVLLERDLSDWKA